MIILRLAALIFGVAVGVGWMMVLFHCIGVTGRMVINGGKLDHELEDTLSRAADWDITQS